jgi:hypothetical protein
VRANVEAAASRLTVLTHDRLQGGGEGLAIGLGDLI